MAILFFRLGNASLQQVEVEATIANYSIQYTSLPAKTVSFMPFAKALVFTENISEPSGFEEI